MTNFYNLPASSEVQRTLANTCLALERGDETVLHAGSPVAQRMSRRGMPYYMFEAGLPISLIVFKGRNNKHAITMELALKSMTDNGVAVVEDRIKIRGMTQVDRRGLPNVYFFGPYSDGVEQGKLVAKLDLVRQGKADPAAVFTEEELLNHIKANRITEEDGRRLIVDVKSEVECKST